MEKRKIHCGFTTNQKGWKWKLQQKNYNLSAWYTFWKFYICIPKKEKDDGLRWVENITKG